SYLPATPSASPPALPAALPTSGAEITHPARGVLLAHLARLPPVVFEARGQLCPRSTSQYTRRPAPACSARATHTSTSSASAASGDRKSTRLNSSHVKVSYAVFC